MNNPLYPTGPKGVLGNMPKELVREVVELPRGGEYDLFIQPNEVGPRRELEENRHRNSFANHFKFADPYTGNTRTYDEQGDYNCGRCNEAEGNICLLVNIIAIDRDAGSCSDWENLCAGDPEVKLQEKSIEASAYGVAENGVGFGCIRCPYASRAVAPDSRGRDYYCGKGDFRTYGTACCALNGAETIDFDHSPAE